MECYKTLQGSLERHKDEELNSSVRKDDNFRKSFFHLPVDVNTISLIADSVTVSSLVMEMTRPPC